MAPPQIRIARCPSCGWGTLADGYYCAYCGQPLRAAPQAQAQPPAQAQQAPPQQAYAQPQANPQNQPNYYQPQGGYAQSRGPSMMSQPQGAAPLICPNCGAPNDPWLTHCRQCQRSLMRS